LLKDGARIGSSSMSSSFSMSLSEYSLAERGEDEKVFISGGVEICGGDDGGEGAAVAGGEEGGEEERDS
jgi:hypothetical protein